GPRRGPRPRRRFPGGAARAPTPQAHARACRGGPAAGAPAGRSPAVPGLRPGGRARRAPRAAGPLGAAARGARRGRRRHARHPAAGADERPAQEPRAAAGGGRVGASPRPVAVVAAGHPETARAGAEAIARGGNAVDGVVGAAYAAAVAEGLLTGPAAGGFLLACEPGGRPTLLDFFVAAPGLGPRGRPLDPDRLDSFEVPFGDAEQVFHIGPASVGVPGMVPGLAEPVARPRRPPPARLPPPAASLPPPGP